MLGAFPVVATRGIIMARGWTYEELKHRIKVLEKEAKEEIRRKTEFLNLVLESLPHPFYVIDASDYTVKIANAAAHQGGLSRGITCYTLTHKSDRPCGSENHPCPLDTIRKTKQPVVLEHLHSDKDGNPRHVKVHGYPIFDEHGNVCQIIATAVDVTESLIKDAQLIQASKMATVGEMATGLAHELKQPLSVIKTASSFLIKKVENDEEIKPEILRTLVEEIDSHVDRASKIIRHMREFGRTSEVKKEVVQVNEPMIKALELLSQQLTLRDIQVIQQLEEGLPMIMADTNRLEQVFINLLTNARDAIEEKWEKTHHDGEGKRISIETRSEGNTIIVEVNDTGIGMNKSIAGKIFDPFFTTKNVDKGTGLGLSISHGIIKDYGGTIEAESQENKGTTFRITFPVAEKG